MKSRLRWVRPPLLIQETNFGVSPEGIPSIERGKSMTHFFYFWKQSIKTIQAGNSTSLRPLTMSGFFVGKEGKWL